MRVALVAECAAQAELVPVVVGIVAERGAEIFDRAFGLSGLLLGKAELVRLFRQLPYLAAVENDELVNAHESYDGQGDEDGENQRSAGGDGARGNGRIGGSLHGSGQ